MINTSSKCYRSQNIIKLSKERNSQIKTLAPAHLALSLAQHSNNAFKKMVYRYIKPKFCHMNTNKSGGVRYIINDEKKTFNDKVYPQLPFLIRSKVSRIKVPTQFGNNPSGQLYGLAHKVTDLVREERLVLNYHKATEVRNHVERLIVEAMHNGDKHRPTMALANFWLLDKSLIHKLFKELVPRYQNYSSAFTALHYLGIDYSVYGRTQTEWKELGTGALQSKRGQCVLELRENNLPPITRPKLNRSELLTNVLCRSAFEHTKQQQQEQLSVKNE